MSYYIFLLVLGLCVIGAVPLPRHVNRRALSLPALQVLAGVVPVMSFVVEKRVHAQAEALLDGAAQAVGTAEVAPS